MTTKEKLLQEIERSPLSARGIHDTILEFAPHQKNQHFRKVLTEETGDQYW